jgi:hypothetical protein
MHPTLMQAAGKTRLADMQRDALARDARQARRPQRQSGDHVPRILASLTGGTRRYWPQPRSS